jgi:hypothetical protein
MMGSFELITSAASRLDQGTIRALAEIIANYVDSEAVAPLHDALSDLLAEPMPADQLLNCALAFANVDALLALTLAGDESAAPGLVSGVIARAANDSQPEVFPDGVVDPSHEAAQALINRVFPQSTAQVPEQLDGHVLVALASYGDAAVVLADRMGIPRSVLGPALVSGVGQM